MDYNKVYEEKLKKLWQKNFESELNQSGEGVVTRRQAAADNLIESTSSKKSPETVKRNRKDEERFAKRQKIRDMPKSPIPSTSTNPPPLPPLSPNWSTDDEKESALINYEEADGSEVQLFDKVTKIYEN